MPPPPYCRQIKQLQYQHATVNKNSQRLPRPGFALVFWLVHGSGTDIDERNVF